MNERLFSENKGTLPPKSVNRPHLPVLFLCDCSGSMQGAAMMAVNRAIRKFVSDLIKSSPKDAETVDFALVSFADHAETVVDWRPLTEVDPDSIQLAADGWTNFVEGLTLGADLLQKRGNIYDLAGTPVRVPILMVYSDGYANAGGPIDKIVERIRARCEDRKLMVWFLGVDGYDKKTAAKILGGGTGFELNSETGYDFTKFFDTLGVVIKKVSASKLGEEVNFAPGELPIEDKDSNVKMKDFSAWYNANT